MGGPSGGLLQSTWRARGSRGARSARAGLVGMRQRHADLVDRLDVDDVGVPEARAALRLHDLLRQGHLGAARPSGFEVGGVAATHVVATDLGATASENLARFEAGGAALYLRAQLAAGCVKGHRPLLTTRASDPMTLPPGHGVAAGHEVAAPNEIGGSRGIDAGLEESSQA